MSYIGRAQRKISFVPPPRLKFKVLKGIRQNDVNRVEHETRTACVLVPLELTRISLEQLAVILSTALLIKIDSMTLHIWSYTNPSLQIFFKYLNYLYLFFKNFCINAGVQSCRYCYKIAKSISDHPYSV